jgi:hypothetical protein
LLFRRIFILSIIGALTFWVTHNAGAEGVPQVRAVEMSQESIPSVENGEQYAVRVKTLPAFRQPNTEAVTDFRLYQEMRFDPSEVKVNDGILWMKLESTSYWIPAREKDGTWNVALDLEPETPRILDIYDIMSLPHDHAVKLVKYPGAKGRIETYQRVGNEYVMSHTYSVAYPKEGPKNLYGDLKTIGGPVIRYLYRTTRSSMNGWTAEGEKFGVYKVSYPMPHDGLPYLLSGKMAVSQYNALPTINYQGTGDNRMLYPHPHSMLGADILIHTARWGSLGCIMVENEAMNFLYHEDLPTENDREIIPLVVYDENVIAPPIGQLF